MLPTYSNSDEVATTLRALMPGEWQLAQLALPAIMDDSGKIGKAISSYLLMLHATENPNLIPIKIGLWDQIQGRYRCGGTPGGMAVAQPSAPRASLRAVLKEIQSIPILISGCDQVTQNMMAASTAGGIGLESIITTNGFVVRLELRSNNSEVSIVKYLNPYAASAYGFLVALWQFPVITWATLVNQELRVMTLSHAGLTSGCQEILTEVSRHKRQPQFDFSKEVKEVTCPTNQKNPKHSS
jgi:hypothetical protein